MAEELPKKDLKHLVGDTAAAGVFACLGSTIIKTFLDMGGEQSINESFWDNMMEPSTAYFSLAAMGLVLAYHVGGEYYKSMITSDNDKT